MSLQLPEKPNLEFLKKQAKELLARVGQGKLSEAQHALAREYGFASWPKLKAHVESLSLPPAEALTAAIRDQNADRVAALLARHADLRAGIDGPLANYGHGQHALFAAVQRGDRATIDVLLAAGADIRKRTEWWAGGFGVLDDCDPSLAGFLIERGAVLDAHSAARLGMLDKLREFIAADAGVVHGGGGGRTPLHFASTIEIAENLLAHGAEIDALDRDHESTPAQHMLRVEHVRHYPRDRQDVARYLVTRGCRTDILMAAALGDIDLVRRHLDRNPESIRTTVNDAWFPKRDPRSAGTIYYHTIGANRTAHAAARDFGHEDVFQLLMDHTPEDLKLALACDLGDETAFRQYLAKYPDAVQSLSEEQRRKLPDAARNRNIAAVRLMLEAGWPTDARGEYGATALHWAAFNGDTEMARTILRFHPPLEMKSLKEPGTPLSWAIYASGNGWHRDDGDFVSTVQALLNAGATVPPHAEELEPSEAVLELLVADRGLTGR